MPDNTANESVRPLPSNDQLNAALQQAAREAALTHARFGRSIPEWRGGQIVSVSPTEIFARYGLDENGRPKPG
jgi:hypothetical protein